MSRAKSHFSRLNQQ